MLAAMHRHASLVLVGVAFMLGAPVLAACSGTATVSVRATPPPQVVVGDNFSGHWRGMANITTSIPDAPTQMGISTTITGEAGQCASIEYGAMGCSGFWSCTSDYSADTMVIQESIRFGHERCPDGARIELRRTNDPNVLEFHYTSPAIQGHGEISRVNITAGGR